MKRRYLEVYPGVDNRFVICDVCGRKFRVKDTIRIVDRFNLLNNMIVCLADADRSNPQIKPVYIHEDLLLRKDYVRPEGEYRYTNLENEDRLPSAPRNLTATLEPITNKIQLVWDGPEDYGNAHMLGYRVYRADGFTELYTIIKSNTSSLATFYLDTTGDINSVYSYHVAAVTDLGISELSNPAYYPKKPDISYILMSQNDINIISMSQDEGNIILEN